jgi:hypothetical protein
MAAVAVSAVTALAACGSARSLGAAGPSRPPSPPGRASRPAPSSAGSPGNNGLWKLKWAADFSEPAPLGSFSGCDNYDDTPNAYCTGLPPSLQWQWWAYPAGWPDSATEVHRPLGGYYDPGHTVWISGDEMHIRLFRTTGPIHSAAVLPKAAIGMLYGKFVERFMVSPGSQPGYRGSHLLWPTINPPVNYEVDYPEGEWDSDFCVHVHSVHQKNTLDFCPYVTWTVWHTAEIDWTPGSLVFYLDGQEIFSASGSWVPDEPMLWVIQNESALYGPEAPPNSWAQLNLSSVAVYSYLGDKS